MANTHEYIEHLHKTGALKKLGTLKLQDGTELSGAQLKEYLADTAKQHSSLRGFHRAIAQETSSSQWHKRKQLQKMIHHSAEKNGHGAEETSKRSGWLGGVFNARKKEASKKVPWYRRASRLEDEGKKYPQTGVSITQHRSGISRVSVDTSAQGSRRDEKINPLTGQPISGGIGKSGPAVGSSKDSVHTNNSSGTPPMPLAG